MQTEVKAQVRHNWIAFGLLLSAIVAAAWAGFHVWERLQKVPGWGALPAKQGEFSGSIGAEWSRFRQFEPIPSIAALELQAQSAGAQLRRALGRPLKPAPAYAVFDAALRMPSAFDDYRIVPGRPLPGTVVRLPSVSGQCVIFRWSPIPVKGVTYTLQISKQRNFGFYRSFSSRRAQTQIHMDREASYFWRVRAHHKQTSQMSPISTLTIIDPPLDPQQATDRRLAARITRPEAWLADLKFCPSRQN